MKEKKVEVKFGILGLGRVVKSRISEVFKKEITIKWKRIIVSLTKIDKEF